jgi:hypothetical protein
MNQTFQKETSNTHNDLSARIAVLIGKVLPFWIVWTIISVLVNKLSSDLSRLGLSLSLPIIAIYFLASGLWGVWKKYLFTYWGGPTGLIGKKAVAQGIIHIFLGLLLLFFPYWIIGFFDLLKWIG